MRGEIFQAISQSKDAKVKKLSADPLSEALKSYKKALSLDSKGRNANSIKIKLTLMENDLMNQAVEAFNNEDYAKALLSFEQILEMKQLPVMTKDNPNSIDTVIIFNAVWQLSMPKISIKPSVIIQKPQTRLQRP